jgi:hypothetical protein
MSTDDVANCVFAYVLIGSVMWALTWQHRPRRSSRLRLASASLVLIVLWPRVAWTMAGRFIRRAR